jgi:hypothetical protein
MVHLTGKASDEVALETAIAVAKRFDGHIDGLLVAANVREDLRPLPPLEFCRGTTKLGVRLSGRRGQRMRELAAIFQRQHGLDALRMAQVRRDRRAPKSEGFRLWNAITRELQQLLSPQLNQLLNRPNATSRQKTAPITIARSAGQSSGGKSDSDDE